MNPKSATRFAIIAVLISMFALATNLLLPLLVVFVLHVGLLVFLMVLYRRPQILSPEPDHDADIPGLGREHMDAKEREKHPERSFYWKAAVFIPIPVFIGWCWITFLDRYRWPEMLLWTSALWSNAATVSCVCAALSFKRKEEKADVSLYPAIALLILAFLTISFWIRTMR